MNSKSHIPDGVVWAAIFLLLVGAAALVSSFIAPRNASSIVVAIGSILLMSTAILILRNHKWALPFAFATASLLTVGVAYDALRHFQLAWPGVGRFLLLAALYWSAFLWYRKWRRAEDKAFV
jgi:hypothetical protein